MQQLNTGTEADSKTHRRAATANRDWNSIDLEEQSTSTTDSND